MKWENELGNEMGEDAQGNSVARGYKPCLQQTIHFMDKKIATVHVPSFTPTPQTYNPCIKISIILIFSEFGLIWGA